MGAGRKTGSAPLIGYDRQENIVVGNLTAEIGR